MRQRIRLTKEKERTLNSQTMTKHFPCLKKKRNRKTPIRKTSPTGLEPAAPFDCARDSNPSLGQFDSEKIVGSSPDNRKFNLSFVEAVITFT